MPGMALDSDSTCYKFPAGAYTGGGGSSPISQRPGHPRQRLKLGVVGKK